ncbi:tetratricopeptide repeat protein [Calothrix sp. CCY 0018]|uniref:tetratricopeptide repeat protein n=1 Tax=Calothrix sp. CCY 0018 TaxID=3103864 RepID=UPI0039C5B989
MLDTTLNSRYHIIKKLGGGGFGETFLACDRWLEDERCVVKQLKPDTMSPVTVRLFEREAQFLTKLGVHDQIPQLLAHFQQDDNFYLVQEFVEGHDLVQEITPGKHWDESDVMYLLEEILKILKFVHKNKIIHRDIKPANIMRRHKDNKIVLIDFGGVKQVKVQTNSTMYTPVVGTQGYMPDEQFKNRAQLCSDIYAVGMVAVQALTGLQPIQLLRDAKTGQLLWQDKAKVSEGLANVVDKMVRFHFAERYQLADEALEAVQNLSLTASYWFGRGDKLIELKDYQEAITAYDQAININPNYSRAWYHRGIALRQLKKYEKAIASYDQVIKIKPDDYQAWYSRGLVLDELDRNQEAISSFDRAIEIKPDYHQAWYYRGLVFNNSGKYDDAFQSFDRAVQITPNYQQAWISRGAALNKLEKFYDAITSFDKAIQIRQASSEAWNGRGWALKNLERNEEAIAAFDKAIQIKQDMYQAWTGRAVVLKKLKEYEDALKSLEKSIQIKQDDFFTWYVRGEVLYYFGRYQESLESFDKVLAINPGYELAIKNRKLPEKKVRKVWFLRWLRL